MSQGNPIYASDIKITDDIVGRWMMIYIIAVADHVDLKWLASREETQTLGLVFRIAAIAVNNEAERELLLSVVGESIDQAKANVRQNPFYGQLLDTASGLREQLEFEQAKKANRRKMKPSLITAAAT